MASQTPGALRFKHARVTSTDEQYAAGKAKRADLPRRAQAEYVAPANRDPLGILEHQNADRLDWLVGLRMQRMLQDPFAFYRGTAALQAADLADSPRSGADVVLCGDAHIANFGLYASPQRTLVFDLNDFDEAAVGPWEWDVKRLVTSVIIAGRHNGYKRNRQRSAALAAARSYRIAVRGSLELDPLSRYYLRAEVSVGSSRFGAETQKVIDRAVRSSERRTSERVFSKITEVAEDGSVRIIEQPPTLAHVPTEIEEQLGAIVDLYRETVAPDISLLLSQYTPTDVARRVVGVGSVGTRCFIVVLTGPHGSPLILQVKEANESVLHQFGGLERQLVPGVDPTAMAAEDGYRVVSLQRILQAVSDPFLGYLTVGGRGFYVRQFRDRNVSFDIPSLDEQPFEDYVDACGALLARAHTQSSAAAFIGGYLGSANTFDEAVVDWAEAYADQSLADFEALRDAVAAGRFPTD
ncbi:MAG: DUF2252 domain-containing protein [Leifsonia sp.]